jgi:hypothetical protein
MDSLAETSRQDKSFVRKGKDNLSLAFVIQVIEQKFAMTQHHPEIRAIATVSKGRFL